MEQDKTLDKLTRCQVMLMLFGGIAIYVTLFQGCEQEKKQMYYEQDKTTQVK